MTFRLYYVGLVALAILQMTTQAFSSIPGPYLQIYPPVNESDGRTPLYFALMLSFGGDFTSIGALPGVQIALDYINSQPSILPGYSLHYTLTDSQCNRTVALTSFFSQIRTPPIKVGWVGSGCSVATEPTAEVSQFYNITQVSCASSSNELSNRPRFNYYFQAQADEIGMARGFLGIIREYGWKKVGIITQDENLFTETIDFLKRILPSDVETTEKRFRSEDGIGGIGGDLFDPDTRIFLLSMYDVQARDVLCEAHRLNIRYPKYLLITYGWYEDRWWTRPASNCTAEDRASVLDYTLVLRQREIPTDKDAVAEPGITGRQFNKKYMEVVERDINKEIDLLSHIDQSYTEPFFYSRQCHEAVLAFGYALNKTVANLNSNEELNQAAANFTGADTFRIQNFTYANTVVVSEMFRHLSETNFNGLTGNPVVFDQDGIRQVNSLAVYQFQDGIPEDIGNITEEGNGVIVFKDSSNNNSVMWPDGIPNDGLPIEDIVTVHVGLTVVYVTLATAGLVFAVVCLVFNLVFRGKQLIRLSSPNLNYIIGLGAIVLYLNVITFVIPTTNKDFAAVLCNINPWLISLGYSLCYGTILVKMVRVWFIFNKPLTLKSTNVIRDSVLALFVLGLIVIDLFILITYTAIVGAKGELGVKLVSNMENPEDIIGPTAEVHEKVLYICESKGQVVLYAVLFGYKGLLQVIALILAFRTRKVKVKGLDDSKYIAAAIYISSIVLAVIIVSTYTLMDYVNVYPTVIGSGFLLGTTMILALVFVPRMVGLYINPEGTNITTFDTGSRNKHASSDQNSGEVAMRGLRLRITELENRLQHFEASDNSTTAKPAPLAIGVEQVPVSGSDNGEALHKGDQDYQNGFRQKAECSTAV